MFNKNISGKRLRELRQSKNLSLNDVAVALGKSRSTIANIEREVKPASLEMVYSLAEFFAVSIDYLVCRSDTPTLVKDHHLLYKLNQLQGEDRDQVIKFIDHVNTDLNPNKSDNID